MKLPKFLRACPDMIRNVVLTLTGQALISSCFASDFPSSQIPRTNSTPHPKYSEAQLIYEHHQLIFPREKSIGYHLGQRMSYHATNYFRLHNLVGVIKQSNEERRTMNDVLGNPLWSEVRRSMQEAVRETLVPRMRLRDLSESIFGQRATGWFEDTLPDSLEGMARRMIGGKPETGVVSDPFATIGIPGQEFHESGRLPRYWTLEPRPFSTNPSLNYTLRTKPFIFGVHAYRKGADAVIELPLVHQWVFTSAIRIKDYNDDRASGYVGLSHFFNHGGYFAVGTKIPIRYSNENLPFTLISYNWRF